MQAQAGSKTKLRRCSWMHVWLERAPGVGAEWLRLVATLRHSRRGRQSLELGGRLHWLPHVPAAQRLPEVAVVGGHGGQLEGQVIDMEQRTPPEHLRAAAAAAVSCGWDGVSSLAWQLSGQHPGRKTGTTHGIVGWCSMLHKHKPPSCTMCGRGAGQPRVCPVDSRLGVLCCLPRLHPALKPSPNR